MMIASKQAIGLPQGVLPPTRRASIHQHWSPKTSSLSFSRRLRAQANPTATSSELLSWLGAQGVDTVKLAVEAGPVGLLATRSVAKGETAASIPESLWITKFTAAESPLGPLTADLEAWVVVALFLIHERSNAASQWRVYLDSLPSEVASPVAWTDAELSELQGTQLLASVEGYRSFFHERYNTLRESLFIPNPEVFPAENFTWEAFLWASCTVRARSHGPLDGDDVALVPLADLIQHSRGNAANSIWALKGAGLFGRGRLLAVEAERAYGAGEAVAMDFGPGRTEGQILLDYGVTDGTAAGGSFALTITLPEDDRFFDDKIDILELSGLQQSNEFVLRSGAGAPESLLPTLRLVNLQGGDAFLLESIFRNEVWEHMQAPVSEDNEHAVCQSIVEGCAAVLASYPTTIDQDVAALRSAAPGSRLAAAISVRLGEKEALESTLRLFESRLGGLKELEYYAERRLKRLGLLDKEGKPTDWDSFFEDGIA